MKDKFTPTLTYAQETCYMDFFWSNLALIHHIYADTKKKKSALKSYQLSTGIFTHKNTLGRGDCICSAFAFVLHLQSRITLIPCNCTNSCTLMNVPLQLLLFVSVAVDWILDKLLESKQVDRLG